MKLSENIVRLIESGYEDHCERISKLVYERLNVPAEEIFSRYFKEQREAINAYCEKNNIDLLDILEANNIVVKRQIGLALIEDEIRVLLGAKEQYDTELKQLGINKHVRLTNGIENAPWLSLFNSPVSLQWWSKYTSKVIENLECTEKQYNYIIAAIKRIKDNWVDPQKTRPDREAYWDLMNMEVPNEINDLIVKQSGN